MKLTNLAIDNRTSIVVLTVLLTLGGLLSYLTIPKESQPSIEIPYIVVTTLYPGASPDDVESLITQHIEQEVQSINGIREIRSTSTEGVSTIVIEFDPEVSTDDAFQKVRDKVDIAKPDLPSDVEEPMVNEIDLSEFPILTINLAADYSLARLKEVAEDLQDELEKIPSVLEVTLLGGLDREVQVNVDLNALQGYNLTFDDVITTIRNENTNIPGGSVDVDRLNYLVRVNGEFSDPAEINDLVISAPGGQPIYVRDVAEVVFGFKERTSYARLRQFREKNEEGDLVTFAEADTEPFQVVSLQVKKRSGENILQTVEQVKQTLDTFPMPSGTRVTITGDESEFIEIMVRDLENNIISGLIFVVAVLLFFLGLRNAALVGIAIPLSMFVSFIVFQAMGQTLNFIILFSLIIALGMLVDNAVVIVENIYRFREQGYGRLQAAKEATAEVAWPVIASTATTLAAFAPMLLWPGIIGEFMSYMPLTLIVTLSSSLFVALFINPVISGIFVRLDNEPRKPLTRKTRVLLAVLVATLGLMITLANWKTTVVLVVGAVALYFAHTRFFKPIGDRFMYRTLPRVVEGYRHFLGWMLERDYTPKRALLRNTLALGALTVGVVLLILGGVVSALMGQASGLVLLVPGGIAAVVGLVGVMLHTLESIYLGGRKSVRAGLIFGAVMLTILLLMYLSPRELALVTIVELMIMPAAIVVVGLAGMLFNRRKHLILTDNRARLLNGSLGALFSILFMFQLAPTGVEFFPDTDPAMIQVTAKGPLGMNIDASDALARQVEDRLNRLFAERPEVQANIKNVLTGVGVGGDQNFGGEAASPERSQITINLIDYNDRVESSSITLAKLREHLQGIPGADIEIIKQEMGPPVGAPVNIEITGPDFNEIVRITREVRQMLRTAAETGRIPGLVDVTDNLNTGRPELKVNIDRERAARFGLNTAQIASTVRAAINGIEASKYRDGENEYDITVRLAESDRSSLESIRNLTILHEGQQIPLVAVADVEVGSGLGSITRLDLQRVATVTGSAMPGVNAQALLEQVQEYLAEYSESLPMGYAMNYTGENEEQQESFGFLTNVLLIAIGLIFLIMVAQFNSVSGPFIIMTATLLSLVGVLLGLIVTRTAFGLFTFIGVISLAGIVVNNGIVLVDYAMQLRKRGMDKRAAIVQAGATRLRPVILTALTTVIGLIPLTFGINFDFVGLLTDFDPDFYIGSENTQFWGPMGTAIISGLTFATFLTLVIVPVMYSTFDSVADRLSAAFGSRGGDPEGDGFPGVPAGEAAPAGAYHGNAAPTTPEPRGR